MATYHKRRSKKYGTTARVTQTRSTNGKSTNTLSAKTATGRRATTQKNDGSSYTTITHRNADGSYSRQRVSSYNPNAYKKKPKSTKRKSSKNDPSMTLGQLIFWVFLGFVVFAMFF